MSLRVPPQVASLDLLKTVGFNKPYTIVFNHTPAKSFMTLELSATANNPIINGFSIVAGAGGGALVPAPPYTLCSCVKPAWTLFVTASGRLRVLVAVRRERGCLLKSVATSSAVAHAGVPSVPPPPPVLPPPPPPTGGGTWKPPAGVPACIPPAQLPLSPYLLNASPAAVGFGDIAPAASKLSTATSIVLSNSNAQAYTTTAISCPVVANQAAGATWFYLQIGSTVVECVVAHAAFSNDGSRIAASLTRSSIEYSSCK